MSKRVNWRPKKIDATESPSLPVPRLEIRWTRIDGDRAFGVYGLVYKHLLGHEMLVPLGSTEVTGNLAGYFERLDAPFRDGAHMRSDMLHLRLRGFVVAYGRARELLDGDNR